MRRSHLVGLAAAIVAGLLGGIALGGHPSLLPGFLRDALVGDKQAQVVRQALDEIHDEYFRAVPKRALADAAIGGMVSSLRDRFSHYLSPRDYRSFQDETHSSYEGIGIDVVPVRRGLRVVSVFDASPAKRAGVKPGDVVVAAAGKSLAGPAAKRGSDLIKGPPGTDVALRVLHGHRVRRLRITRAKVSVPVVASALKTAGGHRLGVVRLATFSSGAHGELDAALKKLLRRGARGIVLDLRGNGGGLVEEAQLVASAFLHGGTVVTTRGRAVGEQTLKTVGKAVVPQSDPVVVLVDHDTASASEIVTGALQDRHRATVVGTHTFGKGVFQQVVDLDNGGALDITAGQYFTPSGRNLGGRGVHTGAGIAPDVRAKDDPNTPADEGLRAALRVLARRLR